MDAIADEMERLVKDAAGPVSAGTGIGAQVRTAWRNLGRPKWWRVKAAWYGEAGCWSARAVEDFRARAAALTRRLEEADAHARADSRSALASARERMATSDPVLYRDQIARIDAILGRPLDHV